MQELAGRTALVTGAARRIGREICLTLARAGADVCFTYRDSQADADSLIEEIAALDRDAEAIRCNVRDPQSVREAVAEAAMLNDRLDILVNNAGVYRTTAFEEITVEEWDEIFETNVRGAFLMTQAAAPHLRKTEGRIVNIGSLGGLRAWETHAHYCSSKAALHMLTEASAKALAPAIAVNAVAPGMIYFGDPRGKEMARHFAAKTPMGKTGTAAEVAQAVLWFTTCPKFVTGQVLVVDGGLGL